MFNLETIIELFALVVIVVSILGSMWLAGHIYFKFKNYWDEQESKRTPPQSGRTDEEEKLIKFWRE